MKSSDFILRSEIFFKYLKQRQIELADQFGEELKFVYVESDILKLILGRFKYKQFIEDLVSSDRLRIFNWKNKFGNNIYCFDLLSAYEMSFIGDLNIGDYRKSKRYHNLVVKIMQSECKVNFKEPAYLNACEYVHSAQNENGDRLRGRCKVDSFGGRLYTPFTRLTNEKKHSCSINGEKLVEIDMKQCQPKILSWLLSKIDPNMDFVVAVENGDIYEHIKSKLGLKSRDEAKSEYYRLVYGHNNGSGDKKFKSMFPEAYKYIHMIKIAGFEGCKDTKRLHVGITKKMHKLELSLFKPLWSGLFCSEIKYLTCHDAIWVVESQVEVTKRMISMYFLSKGIDAEFGVSYEPKNK